MCTVIVRVPESPYDPVRLIAVRDEDPARPWNALGGWWTDDYPGVVGVRDERAGGAWLAAAPDARRLAVVLNREDLSARSDAEVTTRGAIALEAVVGRAPEASPTTRGFNLVDVEGPVVRVVTWDGVERREEQLAAGTHMLAHDGVDDPETARIASWLDAFRAATATADADAAAGAAGATDAGAAGANGEADAAASTRWFDAWFDVLDASADLSPEDDRAIIRDNRPFGYPTQSLLLCTATIGTDGVDVRYGAFAEPGAWERRALVGPVRSA